jgi:hypothetical protein
MVSADRQAAAQLVAGEYEAEAAFAREIAAARRAERQETQRLLEVYEHELVASRPTGAGHPERRRRPRPTVDSLEGLTRFRWWAVVSKLLLLAAAGGDLASFYVTLSGMLAQSQPAMVWILTISLTAAAVGVMHVAGRTARNLREGQGGLGRIALALMFLGWIALGATAFYVRTQVVLLTADTAEPVFGAGTAAAAPPDDHALLSALLLGALFVGSGILAYWIGFSDHHPRMASYRTLRKRLARQRRAVADAERAAVEAERRYAAAEAELRRTADRARAAETSVDAEIAELKELARIHVAGLIGDPAATNNLTTGRSGPTGPAGGANRAVHPLFGAPLPVQNGNGNGHQASAG